MPCPPVGSTHVTYTRTPVVGAWLGARPDDGQSAASVSLSCPGGAVATTPASVRPQYRFHSQKSVLRQNRLPCRREYIVNECACSCRIRRLTHDRNGIVGNHVECIRDRQHLHGPTHRRRDVT